MPRPFGHRRSARLSPLVATHKNPHRFKPLYRWGFFLMLGLRHIPAPVGRVLDLAPVTNCYRGLVLLSYGYDYKPIRITFNRRISKQQPC